MSDPAVYALIWAAAFLMFAAAVYMADRRGDDA